MTKKNLVSSHLKGMNIKPLTPEQKEEYRSEMQKYSERRTRVQEEISDLQEEISLLEEGLIKDIPTTPNGIYVHAGPAGCGFKAVFSFTKDKDAKDHYYCMFCEQDFQLEADGPHKISTKDPLIHE